MSPKKVTLKDIATRCGVTPTIVSAVLNGRNDRITCSPAKRQQIQQVAKELDYQANFFARSIRMLSFSYSLFDRLTFSNLDIKAFRMLFNSLLNSSVRIDLFSIL